MQLTEEQRRYVLFQITREGKSLRDILLQEFPNARIAIVRGHDRFEGRRYVYRACFSEKDAAIAQLMAESSPNGSDDDISDSFYVAAGTARQLEDGGVTDPETRKPLDAIDVQLAYMYLQIHLEEFSGD
ncbi:hypothetical protein HY491_04070 [Candidatus Woesearchaeota archaeon]|nr:hypothetical protein [Candidatus Woesearchaeota archaeon]